MTIWNNPLTWAVLIVIGIFVVTWLSRRSLLTMKVYAGDIRNGRDSVLEQLRTVLRACPREGVLVRLRYYPENSEAALEVLQGLTDEIRPCKLTFKKYEQDPTSREFGWYLIRVKLLRLT